LKRTLRMVSWLDGEVETIEEGERLRENIYAVFNQVPYQEKQAEKRFVKSFLGGGEEKFSDPSLRKRYDTLLTYARQLGSRGVKFMKAYIEQDSEIERFPATKFPEKARGFVDEAASVLSGVLAGST